MYVHCKNQGSLALTDHQVHEFIDHGYSHDEYHASTQILREWQWKQMDHVYWRQPTVFGPLPGPRQDLQGNEHLAESSSSSITATIKFKTSATLLLNLFPNSSYKFAKSDTVALASFSIQAMKNLDWLGGGSYNLLGFYIHDVQYTALSGEIFYGSYCPVMFADLVDPILLGREKLGVPQLYSDILVLTNKEDDGTDYEVRVSWRGAEWAKFIWQGLQEQHQQICHDEVTMKGNSLETHGEGIFVHKYVPASDGNESKPGKADADADYDVMIPTAELGEATTKRVREAKHSEFQISDLGVKQLPTLHHIISRLAEIPVFDVVHGNIVECKGASDPVGRARKISGLSCVLGDANTAV